MFCSNLLQNPDADEERDGEGSGEVAAMGELPPGYVQGILNKVRCVCWLKIGWNLSQGFISADFFYWFSFSLFSGDQVKVVH